MAIISDSASRNVGIINLQKIRSGVQRMKLIEEQKLPLGDTSVAAAAAAAAGASSQAHEPAVGLSNALLGQTFAAAVVFAEEAEID